MDALGSPFGATTDGNNVETTHEANSKRGLLPRIAMADAARVAETREDTGIFFTKILVSWSRCARCANEDTGLLVTKILVSW